jgi:hypothetical protein
VSSLAKVAAIALPPLVVIPWRLLSLPRVDDAIAAIPAAAAATQKERDLALARLGDINSGAIRNACASWAAWFFVCVIAITTNPKAPFPIGVAMGAFAISAGPVAWRFGKRRRLAKEAAKGAVAPFPFVTLRLFDYKGAPSTASLVAGLGVFADLIVVGIRAVLEWQA